MRIVELRHGAGNDKNYKMGVKRECGSGRGGNSWSRKAGKGEVGQGRGWREEPGMCETHLGCRDALPLLLLPMTHTSRFASLRALSSLKRLNFKTSWGQMEPNVWLKERRDKCKGQTEKQETAPGPLSGRTFDQTLAWTWKSGFSHPEKWQGKNNSSWSPLVKAGG